MSGAHAFPLHWPEGWKRTSYRRKSAFRPAGFGRVRDVLLHEVKLMGASNVVLSTNVSLRQDGLPYANQRNPDDPGVAIYFLYKKKQMSFACDSYRKVEENALAIAKTIQAIRGIERWGASDMMERAFRGFAALPENAGPRPWREVFSVSSYGAPTREWVDSRFRVLLKERHPDAGGTNEAMAELNQARADALKEVG